MKILLFILMTALVTTHASFTSQITLASDTIIYPATRDHTSYSIKQIDRPTSENDPEVQSYKNMAISDLVSKGKNIQDAFVEINSMIADAVERKTNLIGAYDERNTLVAYTTLTVGRGGPFLPEGQEGWFIRFLFKTVNEKNWCVLFLLHAISENFLPTQSIFIPVGHAETVLQSPLKHLGFKCIINQEHPDGRNIIPGESDWVHYRKNQNCFVKNVA